MIRPLDRAEFSELYRKHIDLDFPPDEIPPEGMFANGLDEGLFSGYMYVEDDEERGYAFLIERQNAVMLFLFAVYDGYRGQGVGTRFMQELLDMISDRDYIVLEAERPETAENDEERRVREKRLSFYEHLGYVADRRIDYEIYYVPMWLMAHPLAKPVPASEELAAAMRMFYSHVKGLPLRTSLFEEEK